MSSVFPRIAYVRSQLVDDAKMSEFDSFARRISSSLFRTKQFCLESAFDNLCDNFSLRKKTSLCICFYDVSFAIIKIEDVDWHEEKRKSEYAWFVFILIRSWIIYRHTKWIWIHKFGLLVNEFPYFIYKVRGARLYFDWEPQWLWHNKTFELISHQLIDGFNENPINSLWLESKKRCFFPLCPRKSSVLSTKLN